MSKEEEELWLPPTPRSTFLPLPSATLAVDHLGLLPPPLIPHDQPSAVLKTSDLRGRPILAAPCDSLDPGLASPPNERDNHVHDGDWTPTSTSLAMRPRRSAAIVAARNIPRQPSPFDLEGGEGEDADAESTSASPPPEAFSGRAGRAGASKRKVSHSIIERRRRERINECLTTLRETVPSLKAEGERKLARAKERGRKRGRGSDAGERGGLHKLEILQGAIEYIGHLRGRILDLEANTPARLRSPASSCDLRTRVDAAPARWPAIAPPVATDPDMPVAPPLLCTPSCGSNSGTVDDHEAGLLLLEFSTSPELRPVAV
ncbi:hypothetical protein JCM3770_000676 [Rhodotorula araucariae]